MQLNELEHVVTEIQERNRRVETDKAWELSWMRRLFIAAVTFLIAGIWLATIQDSYPWLKALVPAAGYILSTLSLPFAKKLWISSRK